MANDAPRRTRSGGRKGNARRTTSLLPPQMPWSPPINRDRPTEPLDEAGVDAIHKGCMRILSEIGIEFLNPEACEVLRKAGCKVDGTNVKMDEDFVMEMVGYAPSEFTITPRNPSRAITMGGKHMLSISQAATPLSPSTSTPASATSIACSKNSPSPTRPCMPIRWAGAASKTSWK